MKKYNIYYRSKVFGPIIIDENVSEERKNELLSRPTMRKCFAREIKA